MAKRTSSLASAWYAILATALGALIDYVFGHAIGEWFIREAAPLLGVDGARMSGLIASYTLPLMAGVFLVFAAYRVALWHLRQTDFADDAHAAALGLPQMNVTDIGEYLLNSSAWGWHMRLKLNLRRFVKDQVPAEMRRAGRDHEVRFIGSWPNKAEAMEIDRTYWRFKTIDELRIWDRRNEFFTAPSERDAAPGLPLYRFGSAPRVDVLRTWRRASVFLRGIVRFRLWCRRVHHGFAKEFREED